MTTELTLEDPIKILERVKTSIKNSPKEFDMDHLRGPAVCIAGWLLKLTGEKGYTLLNICDFGAILLGCTTWEANKLFWPCSWPTELYEAYQLANTPEERVAAGCMAIDDWIDLYLNKDPQ